MQNQILRISDVVKITGIPKSTIYYKISRNEFPKQVRIGERMVGWLSTDIEIWLNKIISSNDSGDSKNA